VRFKYLDRPNSFEVTGPFENRAPEKGRGGGRGAEREREREREREVEQEEQQHGVGPGISCQEYRLWLPAAKYSSTPCARECFDGFDINTASVRIISARDTGTHCLGSTCTTSQSAVYLL
jgi:hypothetical protein